ncbi:3-hydroxyacyl-CoA dehydrogenase NAD-binding domain-containing protein [Achromobacter spanius]|uniref:3-hydroxyacyl-CoA dehydrogenase n=1 Tax=Achromobacter spanius TaxID=217203 RepID=A0A2S0IB68_9BURK|nr:3-hydroxyacyl-CoA dehydrogenase NAD-binding domain-containing protein [Achromobacter spanius]AVJ29208.1 3-hydroxyacyl-CoA dehydrogenase [Achromobacter spanius]
MSSTTSTQVVTYHLHADVACISIDNPPVNALSQAVRAGLKSAIATAQTDANVKALVLLCKGKTFFAGADIKEFALPPQEPKLADVIQCLEQTQKPVIAAIHGTALGGGLEVALGCHYRIATPDARFGLPEVKLGLLPGAGGTQRLPRLIGAAEALDMIVDGKPISAQHALRIGLVDELAEADLAGAALALARRVQHKDLAQRRVSALTAPEADSELFTAAEQSLRLRHLGYEAPLSCVKAVRAAVEHPFHKGLQIERTLFDELKASPQSRALRHAFFAERRLHKLPFAAKDRSVSRAAVIGAGTMGGGIAMCFANAGIPVVLLEKDAERLSQGLARIEENYANSARRGRLSAGDVEQRLACIQGSTRFEDLADVDLVIEAVFEEIGLKHEIFKTLDLVCKPGAILASNTSYLDIDNIASATRRPQDVVGMHFFSPAHVMQLLENVRGSVTSDEVCATVMEVGRRLGKVAVLVGSCDGFVGNRMLSKRTRESYFLLQEGASPFQIDRVLRDFGLPMGPFAMADLAGLDVGWRNRQSRLQNLTPRERECDMLDRMYAAGRLGQKTQGGFYDYDGDRKATPSPAAETLVAAHRAASGRQARQISDQEILERCLYSMINEAAYILEENIVERASDIDVVWLKGYGFPAYRGGPLCYADQIGLPVILATLRKYEAEHGSQYWKPANLIVKFAQEGRGFHDGSA